MNDIAYWGMLPSLTSDPGERNWLVTVQGIFICIGQFSVAGLLLSLIHIFFLAILHHEPYRPIPLYP